MELPIPITDPERVWLKEIYRRQQAGEPIDVMSMKIALRDKLPKDFTSSQVDARFLYRGRLSLLGILAIDPNSARIGDTERVILAVRDFLIENRETRTISAAQIAEKLGLDLDYTQDLFDLMSSVGHFWSSASGTPSGHGLSSASVDTEYFLQEFLGFDNLEVLLRRHVEEDRPAPGGRFPGRTIDLLSNEHEPSPAPKTHFIATELIDQLGQLQNPDFDLTRLLRYCEEINDNYSRGNYLSVAFLSRGLLDHCPPIFGQPSFDAVAAYAEGRSFRSVAERLNKSLKKIAEHHMHKQIGKKEMPPTLEEINFSADLSFLLGRIAENLASGRLIRTSPTSTKALPATPRGAGRGR
jgi:AraC-like DNA-binding protein